MKDANRFVSGEQSRRWFLKAMAVVSVSRFAKAATPAKEKFAIGKLKDSGTRFVSFDPRFDRLVQKGAPISRLHSGCRWSEGPSWDNIEKRLIWSDVPNDRQWSWNEKSASVSVFREPSRQTNGTCYDAEHRMICCEQVGRRVARYDAQGKATVLVDQWQGLPMNSPNDVVVHPDGGIWFTDPGYGNRGTLELKEATYRIDPVDGKVERVDYSLGKPNGLCFSEDYKRMYIADTGKSEPKSLYVFDVVDGLRLENRRTFANVHVDGLVAGPDGQQVDVDGNLWASAGHGVEGVNGVHVFDPNGKRLGMVLLPEGCANLSFGGSDGKTLFMTATTSLYSVKTKTRAAHYA